MYIFSQRDKADHEKKGRGGDLIALTNAISDDRSGAACADKV